MIEGDVVLTPLPQSDGRIKPRPAILLRQMPPFNDWLVCGVSTQLHQQFIDFDEIIDSSQADFKKSGIKMASLIQLGFLTVLPSSHFLGVIGMINLKAKPFMKWAGGKTQLIDKLVNLFPTEIQSGKIKKYAEPFIGGGALFFYIAQSFSSIEKFFITDVNEELVLAYKAIQKDVGSVISLLATLEKNYHLLTHNEQKDFFYKERDNFNTKRTHIDFDNFNDYWLERASTIIFLNHTCFNGLFRVNSRGEFNVPFGDYKNPKICDAENLRRVSALLQKTEIECADFSFNERFIDEETFVYFDPPYRPISKTASFTSYSKYIFGDDAQKILSKYYKSLSKKGAKLMLSNSDPKNKNPNDSFFEDLYGEFYIERVDASRMINSDKNGRGKIKELVIMNYAKDNFI